MSLKVRKLHKWNHMSMVLLEKIYFFLTLRKPNLTSDLLKDENYLQISDDESVQEMSDSDNDSDNSKEGEEIDLNID